MSFSGYISTSYAKDTRVVVTRMRWMWLLLLALVVAVFPLVFQPYIIHLTNLIVLATMAALALNILTGWAGLVSIGHSAFLAAGGFTGVVLSFQHGLPFWISIPAAALVGAILGVIAGLPAVRLKGLNVVLSTLAMYYTLWLVLSDYQTRSGYMAGFKMPVASLAGLEINSATQWYFVLMFALLAVTIFCINLGRTRLGRAWMAIRGRDLVAEAIGVDVAYHKLLAFAVSSGITAAVGSLASFYTGYVSVEEYSLGLSISYIAMIIVGGLGSIAGTFMGAAFVTLLPYLIAAGFQSFSLPGELTAAKFGVQIAVFGLLIVLFLVCEPEGLVGIWRRIHSYFAIWPFKHRKAIETTK